MKLWVVLILALATAGATKPSTSPTSRPASAMRRSESAAHSAALQSAIAELTREIQAALRSGKEPPRQQSDYFESKGTSDLPPELVIAALRRPNIGGSDPRVQAYVKWQLLSALPAELDDKAAADLVQAYRDAPSPGPRLGMEKHSRDELDRLIRNARQDDVDQLTERFDEMAATAAKENELMLSYRAALFAKLPPSYDAIAAGFEDLAQRIDMGIEPADQAKAVLKAVETWASGTTSPSAEQLREVAGALKQLEKTEGREFYSKLRWSDSTRKLSYSKSRESMSGVSSQLKELQAFLDEKINSPSAPLKLKKEK
jgi:hypothetical protein